MKSIVILASGRGSNAERIIQYFRKSKPQVDFSLITDRRTSGVFSIGERNGVPVEFISYTNMSQGQLEERLTELDPDFIVLAGFLRKIPPSVVRKFDGRMINIHPSLLPKYGGKGMYGEHVHRAIIDAGEVESGITIHYVNEEFDKGSFIAQFYCNVEPDDTLEDLRSKIQKLEHRYYPFVIESLLES